MYYEVAVERAQLKPSLQSKKTSVFPLLFPTIIFSAECKKFTHPIALVGLEEKLMSCSPFVSSPKNIHSMFACIMDNRVSKFKAWLAQFRAIDTL